MPSFQDSAFIVLLALLLFGPKKLPELARQLGKLMAEFRRASNEFRMQMEEELRIADQEEQRKKIAAMEAAAPVAPASRTRPRTPSRAQLPTEEFLVGHPHEQPQQESARAPSRCPSPPQATSISCPLQPVFPSATPRSRPYSTPSRHDPDPETSSQRISHSHEAAQRG